LTVIALAAVAPLIWLGNARSRANHVNYQPCFTAGVIVIGLLAKASAL
jgi:hypothetical protein